MIHAQFLILFCLIFAITLLGVCGYTQELILHESEREDGNFLVFRSSIPDTAVYPLSKIKRICYHGSWISYAQTDYSSYLGGWGDSTYSCINMEFPHQQAMSFRHLGGSSTDMDVVTLYPEQAWSGQEIYVDQLSHSEISTPVLSIAWTGQSNWTIFEWTNFDGKSACLSSPSANGIGYIAVSNILTAYGLNTIGSLMKGCDQ